MSGKREGWGTGIGGAGCWNLDTGYWILDFLKEG